MPITLSPELTKMLANARRAVRHIDNYAAQTCTQAGGLESGNCATGAPEGKVWAVRGGNYAPVPVNNGGKVREDFVGVWVEVGENVITHELDVIDSIHVKNVEKFGSVGAKSVERPPVESPDTARPRHNFTATAAPAVTDDSSDGYSTNSLWVNTSTDIAYICVDATAGAAVWKRMSGMAPADATYITQTANSELSAEQALASLATGLLKNTTTTGVLSIGVDGTDYFNAWVKVKNTSGGTAAAQDVGYINGSNEYKTTTTANDPNMVTGGCVVLVGGANNADIYVARRGGHVRLKLNGNCSIGDYLFSSTTAGQASVSTTMRPELFAIAQTANAGGAGGTCEALLYTGRAESLITNAESVLLNNAHDDTVLTAAINGAPTATSVVYDTVVGSEDVLAVAATTQLGKIRLYNSTRGNYRLVTACDTGTNTITTVSSTDNWADNDVLTIESPTVASGGTEKFVEIDLSQMSNYPPLATAMLPMVRKSDSGAGINFITLHPFETFAATKQYICFSQVAGIPMEQPLSPVPLVNKVFCWRSGASGTGASLDRITLAGFIVAIA